MSKDAPPDQRQRTRKRKPAPLSEDEVLWNHVARQVTPARRMKPRVHAAADSAGPHEVMLLPKAASRATRDQALAAATRAKSASPAPPSLAEFDKKKVRRIASGRIEIDARLDMHGLRQDEAHVELRRFLFQCRSRDHRIVLVITGKGGAANADDDDPILPGRERGVLKRNVPRWLAEPELRAIVVGYTEAHARHGGAGAIYVHLRASTR